MLRSEVDRNIKGRKRSCQLMVKNDNSWSQEDDSWRKPTSHVELVGRQAIFFCSVLSPIFSDLTPEHVTPETFK